MSSQGNNFIRLLLHEYFNVSNNDKNEFIALTFHTLTVATSKNQNYILFLLTLFS